MHADELRRLTKKSQSEAKERSEQEARVKAEEQRQSEELERERIPAVLTRFEAALSQAAARGSNEASFLIPMLGERYPGITAEALAKYCGENLLHNKMRSVPLYTCEDGLDMEIASYSGQRPSSYRYYLDVSW